MSEIKNDHDLNSTLSALHGGIDLLKTEWNKNPEIIERIIPLMKEKLDFLENKIKSEAKK